MTIIEILTQVKNTAGSNAKKEILKANMSQLLKDVFMDAYGDQKYYVTKKPIEYQVIQGKRGMGTYTIEDNYYEFHDYIWKMANREITGGEAKGNLINLLHLFKDEDREWLIAIIDRNLKVGVSFDNFNAVLEGNNKAPKYEVSLAENLDNVKNVDPLDGTYFASRKLDGVRCEAHVYNYTDEDGDLIQEIYFKSRQGKEFTTLDKLKTPVAALTKGLRGRWVLDGECCITDDEGNEDFNGIMRQVTRKDHTIERPRYKLFDIITQDQFDGISQSPKYSERLVILKGCYGGMPIGFRDKIEVLEQELLTTQEQFDKWAARVKEFGWEGFMLHKDAPYKSGRSNDLLKVKKFKDAEYVVEDVKMGKAVYNEDGAKEYDVVASLIINHKGNQVDVGSGLSKEQRIEWFKDPSKIIGKTITVQYFSETKNKNDDKLSLRFPVLKWVYEDGRNV